MKYPLFLNLETSYHHLHDVVILYANAIIVITRNPNSYFLRREYSNKDITYARGLILSVNKMELQHLIYVF